MSICIICELSSVLVFDCALLNGEFNKYSQADYLSYHSSNRMFDFIQLQFFFSFHSAADLPEETQPEKTEEDENEEKSYEREERSFCPLGNDMKSLLPFKTKEGIIARYTKREGLFTWTQV